MLGNSDKEKGKKKVTELKTFSVPFALEEIKENIAITTKKPPKPSKEQIINQAFKFHSEGNILEAAKLYQYFINKGFSDHRVFSNYGVILKNLGKLKEAELLYRKANEIKPVDAKAQYNLGNVLRDLGKLKEAEMSYLKAIEIKPDLAEAHLNLGNTLKDLGKLKEAEMSYLKAIEIKPDYADAYLNLGVVLKGLGKLEEAELSTRKAIEIQPDYADAHYSLAQILIEVFQHSEDTFKLQQSIIPLNKAIQINPNFAEAFLQIGEILLELGREKEAEKYIQTAIKLNSNEAIAYKTLGKIYNKLGKQKEAEEFLQRAIKLDPKLESAHFNLGINYLIRNNLDSAIESFKTAQFIKPDNKYNQILISFSEARYNQKANSSIMGITGQIGNDQGLENNPLILNREVENELLDSIFKIQNISHVRGGDPSFGNTNGSNYDFLDNDIPIIKVLKKDLMSLLKDNLKRNIFIHTSFSTILGKSGGGLNKHNHIAGLDLLKGINLSKKKFSLVYYLSIGDQNCNEPGYLSLYEPEEKILPNKGMIITFPADRYHSIIYNGTKVRVAIVVNYYAI